MGKAIANASLRFPVELNSGRNEFRIIEVTLKKYLNVEAVPAELVGIAHPTLYQEFRRAKNARFPVTLNLR
ncbi:MAG: hypothetical protein RIG63_29675 [Coleofasciculus chthonoplastes F3-SA18-01]|uniref:hypothetical protein n=1 Tax=Coleofasciculus chthonoplastes TaxID=64178 RepID=UPI0032F1DF5B